MIGRDLMRGFDNWLTTQPTSPDEPEWSADDLDEAWMSLAEADRDEVVRQFMEDDADLKAMVSGAIEQAAFDVAACCRRFDQHRNEWLIDQLADGWHEAEGPLAEWVRKYGAEQ